MFLSHNRDYKRLFLLRSHISSCHNNTAKDTKYRPLPCLALCCYGIDRGTSPTRLHQWEQSISRCLDQWEVGRLVCWSGLPTQCVACWSVGATSIRTTEPASSRQTSTLLGAEMNWWNWRERIGGIMVLLSVALLCHKDTPQCSITLYGIKVASNSNIMIWPIIDSFQAVTTNFITKRYIQLSHWSRASECWNIFIHWKVLL